MFVLLLFFFCFENILTHILLLVEEADELCSKIGILVGGRLACLGSAQHLKNRYSYGYCLEIEFAHDAHNDIVPEDVGSKIHVPSTSLKSNQKQLVAELERIAGKAQLIDWHKNFYKYQFQPSTPNDGGMEKLKNRAHNNQKVLPRLFACIEDHRVKAQVHTYSLTQTTLEQVFLKFAEKQNLVNQRIHIRSQKAGV